MGGRDVGCLLPAPPLTDAFLLHPTNHTAAVGREAGKYFVSLSAAVFFVAEKQADDNEKKFPSLFPSEKQDGRLCSSSFSKFIDFPFFSSFKLSFSRIIIFSRPRTGFPHHLPGMPTSQGHLAGSPDWRVLNNRPFPPSQYFHHHSHFATHNVLAAIDRMERPFLDGSECR